MTVGLRIRSGGQTGADQAALTWAVQQGIPHEGWCPKGRRDENGPIPAQFELVETASRESKVCTAWNVRDADATVIFTMSPELTGGTLQTKQFAEGQRKPLLHLCRQGSATIKQHAAALNTFLSKHSVGVLNVAGPRASKERDVASFVQSVLTAALCSAEPLPSAPSSAPPDSAPPLTTSDPPGGQPINVLSISELKRELTTRHVDFSGCVEKQELQALLADAVAVESTVAVAACGAPDRVGEAIGTTESGQLERGPSGPVEPDAKRARTAAGGWAGRTEDALVEEEEQRRAVRGQKIALLEAQLPRRERRLKAPDAKPLLTLLLSHG